MGRYLVRGVVIILAVVVMASGCRISTEDVTATLGDGLTGRGTSVEESTLPVLGPIPASSHWHAAYVVRICDDVLPPFESDADPLGIHSHGDGVMHVHPFFAESGYESARLSHFADAMGFELTDGSLTLPGGGTWRDGDLCNGVPGRVFVDRWRDPDPESEVERIFTGLDELRYLADGELYQIAFAPMDSLPVVPPSTPLLAELSNLRAPTEPWVSLTFVAEDVPADDVRFWEVAEVADEPCANGALPESVLSGVARCFVPAEPVVGGADGVRSARAVLFNREPSVELRMGPGLARLIGDHFAANEQPLALGVEVAGAVVSAPLLARAPLGDRLVISGGFSVATATRLAELLDAVG